MDNYDVIMERVLDRMPDHIDKREGSVVYLAVASTIAELMNISVGIEHLKSKFDIDNLVGDELENRVKNRTPLNRLPGVRSKHKVEFEGVSDIAIGSKFTGGDIYFTYIGNNVCESEDVGSKANTYFGEIIPVNTIPSLAKIEIVELLSAGYDVESDDSLRERYYEYRRLPATSGNESHYMIWAKEVPGIGDVRVIPLWNGGGTVKVIVADTDREEVSEETVLKVKSHIESKRPVGADVTVESAVYKDIMVKAKLKIEDGYDLSTIEKEISDKVSTYYKGINPTVHSESKNYSIEVSYAKIGSLILSTKGVLDYSDYTLNDEMSNITLDVNEIANFKYEFEVM